MQSRIGRLAGFALIFFSAANLPAQTPTASPAPTPTPEQRVAGIEAYLTNSDPTAPFKIAKDSHGNVTIPAGLTSPSSESPRQARTAGR